MPTRSRRHTISRFEVPIVSILYGPCIQFIPATVAGTTQYAVHV